MKYRSRLFDIITQPGKFKLRVSLMTILMLPVAAIFLTIPSSEALSVNSTRDCNTNAVINCGALSTGELINKYNSDPSVNVIFSHFGIGRADIESMNSTAQAGEVSSNGDVRVNGKLVATNAMTAGRQDIAGSQRVTTNGVTFFVRPPSVSFVSSPLAAFAVMKQNGQFDFAILASCGNPVRARPMSPAPTPAPRPTATRIITKVVTVPVQVPAPAPSQTQTQSQSQTQNITVQAPTSTPAPTPSATSTSTSTSSSNAATSANATASTTTPVQTQTSVVTSPPTAVATTTTTTPVVTKQLPNTGPGDVVEIAAIAMLGGTLSHYFYRRWKRY